MIYDLSKDIDKERATAKFTYLLKNGKKADIKEVRNKRTIKQNAYLHVLFTLFGIEVGLTIDESKTYIKRELKFFYEKQDMIFLKKTSECNTKELTDFIEKFRNLSSKQGIYLPTADEYTYNYQYFDNLIYENRNFVI